MRIRFTSEAGGPERQAAADLVRRRGLSCETVGDELALLGRITDDDAVAIAAMPGVVEVVDPQMSRREVALLWLAGAAATLGALSIIAANLPAKLGSPADPSHSPGRLQPTWPLLPWYAAVERAPSWVPVSFLLVLAAAALFAWPTVGRRLAERRPWFHAALGAAALLLVAGLAAWEIVR